MAYDDAAPPKLLTRYDIADLNAGAIPKFPVANPPGWDDISHYYCKALQRMGFVDPPGSGTNVEQRWTYGETPTSAYFEGAMHWAPRWGGGLPPAPQNEWWSHCTHGPASAEKYFLPWHRALIYWFEVIVRSYVADLGGPEDWALPYWNYSFFDTAQPSPRWPRAKLPWAFTQPKLKDGTTNPLFLPQGQRGLLANRPGTTDPWFLRPTTPDYSQAWGQTDYERFNEMLDFTVHGAVHVDTGTGNLTSSGWMQSTVTAGFDPIFWLHHSQVDRFWASWNAAGNPNPADATWREALDDPMRANRWNFWRDDDIANRIVVYPGELEDPASLTDPFPYAYQYDTLNPPPPTPPSVRRRLEAGMALAARRVPAHRDTVLAVADQPITLGARPVSAEVPVTDEAPPVLERLTAAEAEPPRVELDIEDVVAEGPPGNYEVYLNYPDADSTTEGDVPHYVGLMSGFGADHHDEQGEGHEAHHGMDYRFDITDIVAYLVQQGGWDESKATVTFVPATSAAPEELTIGDLTVGKVTITTV